MQQNKITYFELEKILEVVKTKNVDKSIEFNYFKMFKNSKEPFNSNVLYFPVYLNENDDGGGWYPKSSDARKKLSIYIHENPHYTYVLNQETYDSLNNNQIKAIIVPDIMQSIDKLFNYILNNRKHKTILVTGSVGKTTAVGLIRDVIKDNVLMLYAKRITPIVLKFNIINYLTNDIKYLVFEAGMYYKHHVKYFSDTLRPSISICLNILPEHLGIDNIKSVEDIVVAKTEIFKYSKYALVNLEDKELKKLIFSNGKMKYGIHEMPSKVEKVYDISKINKDIDLYIKTWVSKLQFGAAYNVGKILNIDEKLIVDRLNKAKPIENRLSKNILFGRKIIFDGEVSGVARFSMFTNHLYEKAILIIRALTENGEENEDYTKFPNYFKRFEKVYLFDDLDCLNELKGDNTEIVSNHDFIKNIDEKTPIFYHYGSYFRKYDNFSIDNLDRK